MFTKLQMEIHTEESCIVPFQKAIVLQRILMEQLQPVYVEHLHESRLHPYSQSVFHQQEKNIWSICTVNKEAYEQIILPVYDSAFKTFFMEHDKWNVSINEKKIQQIDRKSFMKKYYFADSGRFIRLAFQTPTAFKQAGEYVFYPDLRLLYQNLMMKYDAAVQDETLHDEELLEQLMVNSTIIGYRLKSCFYSVHGSKIPAFMGEITIRVKGPQTLVNLINMLCHFGEYSGIGIKTAMGMGKLHVVEKVKE
ncbi:MAG: CRISPR-associated endoribonuclease Cas6 [Lachnospiraceae bacterium]|nr:CRISPR-associated endoribonuclease Cas6 [Lachnospiraceae bacterium]